MAATPDARASPTGPPGGPALTKRAQTLPGGALALAIFGALLILGVWITITFRARAERAEALSSEIRKNANLVLATEVQTRQLLAELDRFLLVMRHQAERPQPRVPLSELVAPAFGEAANITLFAILDAAGDVVDAVSAFPATNAADRPMFKHHQQDSSRDLLISPPTQGRMSGRWVITLTRRVNKPDDTFGGMVIVSLEPRYMTSLFEQAELGPMDVMSQVLVDGVTLARRLGGVISFGEDISQSQLMKEYALRPIGNYVGAGGVDGHQRIFSYRKVPGYPVLAIVGTSEESAMAPVGKRVRTYYLGASLASAVIALVCSVGVVLLLRQQRINRQLLEQASLLDEAQDAIMVSGLDQRLTYWNRSAERLYGWPADQVLGRAVHDVLYPHDRALVDAARTQAERSGTWLGELHPTARDGRRVVAQSRWTLVRDGGGRPISLLTIDTDITERRQLEQQFYRTQRLESLGTLAGGIAHDLNNVLAPIMLANEILYDRATDDDSRELLSRIGESARRGAEMVGQVLAFARGQEGRRVEVQVRPLVAEVARIARDSLPKDIAIAVQVPDGLPALVGDATQFHQVLLNLCVNARDAMPDGGRLVISAAPLTLPTANEPLLADFEPGPYVVLQVEDTGVGIPPTEIDRIFDPFFTTKAPGKGTGLGLSTSLTIVKSHGGQIRVHSEPGRGTRFRVYLPAHGAARASVTADVSTAAPRGRGETVLFVDDEPAIRRVATHALESYGYRVLTAGDGVEGLALYKAHTADIAAVVTDMMMPGLGGEGLIRELRRLNPAVRIIACSGISSHEATVGDSGGSVLRFLAKPFSSKVLRQTLASVLAEPLP